MTYSDNVSIDDLEEKLDTLNKTEFYNLLKEAGYSIPKDEEAIPEGNYCYERKNEEIIQCPYWEKEEQAYCTFEEDSDGVLLDDQVKICGINEAHEIELTDEEPEEEQPSGHRWSGWPGAWCLDCGIKDPMEYCQANHEQPCNRDECDPGDCEHRGEGLYDPYKEDDE